jgi:hypothetical protein
MGMNIEVESYAQFSSREAAARKTSFQEDANNINLPAAA